MTGADYRLPIVKGFAAHFWANNVYRTTQNFDNNLSRYGIQGSYAVTDLGLGIVAPNDRFELDIVAKNAFDRRYTTSITVNSDGRLGYDGVGDPRWIAAVLHVKL